MAATLMTETLNESINNGFLQYSLSRFYRVYTSGREQGATTALSQSGLPPLGIVAVLPNGVQVWCQSRSPVRPDPINNATEWRITCVFTNATSTFQRDENGNPVSDPEQSVKQVDITFQEYPESVTDATLKNITAGGPSWAPGSTVITNPEWLDGRTNEAGPVTNSANKSVNVERSSFRKIISVSRQVNDWVNAWDGYLGAINSDEITIVQRDSQGPRLTQVFPPETLLMQDVVKEDVWKDARLYFRVRFVMAYNPNTWVHPEIDRGMEKRLFVDQYKPDGSQYVQADLDEEEIEGTHGLSVIKTGKKNEKVSLGEPIQFNGSGAEQPTFNFATGADIAKPVYLNWDVHEKKPFTALAL